VIGRSDWPRLSAVSNRAIFSLPEQLGSRNDKGERQRERERESFQQRRRSNVRSRSLFVLVAQKVSKHFRLHVLGPSQGDCFALPSPLGSNLSSPRLSLPVKTLPARVHAVTALLRLVQKRNPRLRDLVCDFRRSNAHQATLVA